MFKWVYVIRAVSNNFFVEVTDTHYSASTLPIEILLVFQIRHFGIGHENCLPSNLY